jgi:SAM-dependent methyltransferase
MSTTATAGTAGQQGRLWSAHAAAWAELHEHHMEPVYRHALDSLGVREGTRLLDVGCGAGRALRMAADRGAEVSGIDAADGLLAYARRRVPGAAIVQGELQTLPFYDGAFDAVTGFNAFQYAADPVAALREARRVAAPGGRVLACVWSPPELCGLAPHLKSLGALMPPPPPNAPGPFALTGRDALAALFTAAGLALAAVADVPCVYAYPDTATAIAALSSAGPVQRVAEHAGEEAVRRDIEAFLAGHVRPDGGYAISNAFRCATSEPV